MTAQPVEHRINLRAEVVIVGAGAAGMAAAIAAARARANVKLVERTASVGGTVAKALIHTLGGIYDQDQQLLNGGLVAELTDRLFQASSLTRIRRIGKTQCLNVCPQIYQQVVEQWLADEGIDYFFVDQHGVANADPRPVYGIYAPIRLPGGCHALARDGDASRQVWSAREGYPGDPAYREFYRDLGYDAEYSYIRPYLHSDGVRRRLTPAVAARVDDVVLRAVDRLAHWGYRPARRDALVHA